MMKRLFLMICALSVGVYTAEAKRSEQEPAPSNNSVWSETTTPDDELLIDVVDPLEYRDGVSIYEPLTRRRRVDREINKRLFIQKGEYMFGVSGSHNEINSKNAEMLLVLDNITAEGSISTVKPFAGYFYRDNRAAGARFTYTTYSGLLDSASLDLGDTNDLSFDVPYINLSSKNYGYSLFHRSYAALDNNGHFGVFAEMELSAAYGDTKYAYESGDSMKSTHSKSQSYALSFNPGLSAFIYNNVCASLSFEFGGLHYTNIKQYDEAGAKVGERDASKMQFMFNVFAINFGVTIHLW